MTYPNGISGIGIPTVTRDLQRHPNIQGAFDQGYKLEPREINLNLYYTVASAALADARRDAIYKIFRPFDDPLKLKITRDDSAIRQIDVHTIGMVDLPPAERIGFDQGFTVRLLAPDPIWYEPTQYTSTTTPSGTNWTSNIAYSGNWEEYPVIRVYGLVTGFSFTMTVVTATTSNTYQIQASSISAGDWWEFDMRPGYKTVKDSSGVSVLGSLAEATYEALFKMRLFPDPIEAGGVNGTGGSFTTKDANHKVVTYFYNRYLGI